MSIVAIVLSRGLPTGAETHLDTLRRAFSDYRLGQFMHFGMNTFNGMGQDVANEPVTMYKPTKINPAQWVSASKAGGFKYMVLVCKHQDGFCNWATSTTTYNCTNSAINDSARKDVVALFVQACIDSGMVPCLYLSVQDRSWKGGNLNLVTTSPMENSTVTGSGVPGRLPASYVDYTFTQERELLEYGLSYGSYIPLLITDGWAWSMGKTVIPYQNFRDTMYKYSPNTIFSDHEGLFFPWQEDIVYYENSKGVIPPVTNIYASWLSNKGGHGSYWFWVPSDSGKPPAVTVSSLCNNWVKPFDSVWCNTTPCIDPNDQGLMQPEYVTWLAQFGDTIATGKYLKASRKELPAQPPHMEYVITAISAAASSTGSNVKGTSYPDYAIDGVSDGGFADYYTESIWTSSSALPQYITVDLGAVYNGINMCQQVPVQISRTDTTKRDSLGSITGYTISYSNDDVTFTPVTLNSGYNGTWVGNTAMKVALFQPVNARYMRLTATATIGNAKVEISQVDFGYSDWKVAATGVKRPASTPVPTGELKAAGCTGIYLSLGKNGLNMAGMNGFSGTRPVTFFSIDGRRLYQQEGIPVLPGSFAFQAVIARQK